MAENILGGGNLYTAKPVNVINPGGMTASQSIDTIAGVGEGNRQRALQASEGQKNRNASAASDMRNERLQRDKMSQDASLAEKELAQRGATDQQSLALQARQVQLQEQEAREAAEERDRANRLALRREQLDLQRQKALRARIDVRSEGTPLPSPGPVGGDLDGDGMVTTPEELEALQSQITAEQIEQEKLQAKMLIARQLLDPAQTEAVADVVADFDNAKTAGFQVRQRAFMDLPMVLTDTLPEVTETPGDPRKIAQVRKFRAMNEGSGPASIAGDPGLTLTDEQWDQQQAQVETKKTDRLKVDRLAEHIAAHSHGKMAVDQVATQTKVLLSALDGLAQGDKTQEQVAVNAFKSLQAGGADTDVLSDIMARTMWQATQLEKDAANTLVAAAETGEKVDKDRLASGKKEKARGLRIANMARMLSQVKGEDGNPLVSDFGSGTGMYDLTAAEFSQRGVDMRDTVKEVFGAIIGSQDPAAIISALRDGDPTNDPQVGTLVRDMSPKLKTIILDAADREYRQLQASMTQAGYGNVAEIANYNAVAGKDRIDDFDRQLDRTDRDLARLVSRGEVERNKKLDALDTEYEQFLGDLYR